VQHSRGFAVWTSVGLQFMAFSAITPLGIAILFVAFSISCLSRVFLRSRRLKNIYMVLSFVPLLYLVLIATVGSSPTVAPTGDAALAAMLFAMLVGMPFSIGWLLGWPIAVLVQLAARGPNSSTSGANRSQTDT
jgi:hypothetical protein